MVQRYDVGGHDCYMDIEQDGAWVKYEDYAALLECHLQTCNKLGRAAEALLAKDESELRKALLE